MKRSNSDKDDDSDVNGISSVDTGDSFGGNNYKKKWKITNDC